MILEFKGVFKVEADLVILTGLHIGGSKESFEIGGLDNPVIKLSFPVDLTHIEKDWKLEEEMPYIPGSSLKGKMRSLLEWIENRILENENKGDPCGCGNCVVCKIFGAHKNNKVFEPVKLKISDAYPKKETIEQWKNLGNNIYTEIKTENVINRITSAATPRPVERVPAGSIFWTILTYEIFKDEDLDNFQKVFIAMKALEDNFLGGGGSRGNGRVIFKKLKIKFISKDNYLNPSLPVKEKEFDSVKKVIDDFNSIKTLATGSKQ